MSSLKRNSNIELLRIVIMFMILLLHANFFTFKMPTDHSFISFSRCFAEAFTLTPVNIFVLITGFFSTVFSVKKVLSLLFQVFFCIVTISLLLVVCGVIEFEYQFFLINNYWFINAYIGLLVFIPVLNAAVAKFSQKEFKYFLIFFYALILVSHYIGLVGINVALGYSIIWFIFLYMLGRYIRNHPASFSNRQLIFLIIVSCLCKSLLIFYRHDVSYIDPFIVIQSVSTLLLFSKIEFQSKRINSIAVSTTMVYLINLHPVLKVYYKDWLWVFYLNNGLIMFLFYTILLCVSIFILAIIYDKIRIYFWKKIDVMINKNWDIIF